MITETPDTLDEHVGTDSTAAYPWTFRSFESGDIEVKVRDPADDSETTLALSTNYTLSGVGGVGGTVTLLDTSDDWNGTGANLETGWKIYIYFVPSLKQLTKFRDLGRNAPVNIEKALDRLTMFLKAFFETTGLGDVARALKLPTNVHPSEFDPVLPPTFDSAENNAIVVNAAKNGWKVLDLSTVIVNPPTAIQSIAGGGTATVILTGRQHIRVKSTGGAVDLSTTPFGTTDALLQDGMEIIMEADSETDTVKLKDTNIDYGFQGNGDIEIKYPYVTTLVYNATKKRFLAKSVGAW